MESAIKTVLKLKHDIDIAEDNLRNRHAEVFKEMEQIEAAKANLETMLGEIKNKLEEDEDYDVHEASCDGYKIRLTLSKTTRLVVDDVDKVPDEFVSVQKVADIKKLEGYYKLYGECPEGCVDKSFTRFNKRIEREA